MLPCRAITVYSLTVDFDRAKAKPPVLGWLDEALIID